MKDFDTVAEDGGGGGTATVNVQHKKQFDGIADVDLNAMKLMVNLLAKIYCYFLFRECVCLWVSVIYCFSVRLVFTEL